MSYVIYEVASTKFVRIMRNGFWQDAVYKTPGAANAALNKMIADPKHLAWRGLDYGLVELAIAEKSEFHSKIEKQETKRNLLSGKEFQQPVNTPLCCDPSSETYWSM